MMKSEETRERYLADVSHQLRRSLSPLELYESVEEMRQHLNSMAAAYIEIGEPPDDAMAHAIERFGASKDICARIAKVSLKPGQSRLVALLIAGLVNVWVGAALLIGCDLLFQCLRIVSQADPGIDFGIGAGAGFFACVLALVGRRKPWINGIVMAVLTVVIMVPMNSVALQLGSAAFTILLGLCVTAMLIGISGSILFGELELRVGPINRNRPLA